MVLQSLGTEAGGFPGHLHVGHSRRAAKEARALGVQSLFWVFLVVFGGLGLRVPFLGFFGGLRLRV